MSNTSVSLVRRLDLAVFAVERALLVGALAIATTTVALDVLHRNVQRVAAAPTLVAAVVVIAALSAAYGLSRSRAPLGRTLAWAAGAVAVGGALWLALALLPSRGVYLVLGGVALAGLTVRTMRNADAERRWLTAGALVLAAGPPLFFFTLRYMPDQYAWSKEIAMLLVLWVGFFGASVCTHAGRHVRIEALDRVVPPLARPWVEAAGHLATTAFCLLLAWLGWRYVFHPEHGLVALGATLELSGVPDWVQTIALPIAFGLTALRAAAGAFSAIRHRAAGEASETKPERSGARRWIPLAIVLAIAIGLAAMGGGWIVLAIVLVLVVVRAPVFVILGVAATACFFVWGEVERVEELTLVERIRGLADNQALLAIPFFMLSGSIMARGKISERLVAFSRALVGFLPGGMAVAAVLSCAIFAAISGSSPATVVAIGGMMGPALVREGYSERFSYGLVTSAGSLGILIPPSIPMIVYAIVNTTAPIEVERLFAAGYGPGLVIGGALAALAIWRGVRDRKPRQPFSIVQLGREMRAGSWSLAFPLLIAGGIYTGVFNAVEAGCFSVVYAALVEVFLHRSMGLRELGEVLEETGVVLGSFLVILVVAMSFGEFLEGQGLPARAAAWVGEQELSPWQLLIVLNLLLLVVGCLLDIMSAIFLFVPLLAPMAMAAGIDPVHFGIIFVVNLEIGYLTPPVGLNLFVASTLFDRPVGWITRAALPFVGAMLVGLALITFSDAPSVGLADLLLGRDEATEASPPPDGGDAPADRAVVPVRGVDAMQSLEEMMREAEEDADEGTEGVGTEPEEGSAPEDASDP